MSVCVLAILQWARLLLIVNLRATDRKSVNSMPLRLERVAEAILIDQPFPGNASEKM